MFEVFAQTTPLVEGLSIDEAFLDARGLERISGSATGSPRDCGAEVRAARRPADHGRGRVSTKFLAKVASGVAKPDGLLVVPPGGELGFLHPLPVERLWGVGPVSAQKLHERGLVTVGEVAQLAEAALVVDAGPGGGAPPPRPRPQPRPTAGPGRAPSTLDRGPARARARAGSRSDLDAVAHRAHRPPRPPAARSAAGLPHGHSSAALRRLLSGDPVPHAAGGDGANPADPRHRGSLLATAMPMICAGGGSRSSAWRLPTSPTMARSNSRSRSIGRARRPRRRPRRHPRPVRVGRHRAGGADRPRSGADCPAAPRLGRHSRRTRASTGLRARPAASRATYSP